jgi:hypothetical protein
MATHILPTPDPSQSTGEFTPLGNASRDMFRMLVDIGDRLGLFAYLALGAQTSPALAARSGVNEAYLCEWLLAMVDAGRLRFDPHTLRYTVAEAPATVD